MQKELPVTSAVAEVTARAGFDRVCWARPALLRIDLSKADVQSTGDADNTNQS